MTALNNQSPDESATPRTDKDADRRKDDYYASGYVDEDVCREIERDLNKAVRLLRYHMQVGVVTYDDEALEFLESIKQ